MKILNISTNDYANFAHDNANALRAAGANCIDLKTYPHPYGYKTESPVVPLGKIIKEIESSDVIQIFHSDPVLLPHCLNKNKKIIVYHTGTRYRLKPDFHNKAFNPHVFASVIALCEFSGLGSYNEKYLVGAINVPDQEPPKYVGHPLTVAHYPSNAKIKGTPKILEMVKQIPNSGQFVFKHDSGNVPHDLQLERYKKCDIYLELFRPTMGGKPYGSWGITALECAAMGKIVITQNLNNKIYEDVYGKCELLLADNEQDFMDHIDTVVNYSSAEIYDLQKKMFNWVKNNHSFKATGERILKIINDEL